MLPNPASNLAHRVEFPAAHVRLSVAQDQSPVTRALSLLRSNTRRTERDEQLVRAHDPQAPIFVVDRGWAFRYCLLPNGQRQILYVSLPGDVVGLDTLLTGSPDHPMQGAGPVTMTLLDRERASQMVTSAGWFRGMVVDSLARERNAAQATLVRLGRCNAEERVAFVLLDFHARLDARGLADGNRYRLELTQQHLADLLGLTSVHLNRVLQRLRTRGMVDVSNHIVTLRDIPGMEALAMFSDADRPTA